MTFPLAGLPVGFFKRSKSLWQVIQECGLTSNCKLCLDAGDSSSYDGSSQTWYDLSGNGFDWYCGATSGAEASDPTFNGSAGGKSPSEYWSFDGGDWFVMAVAEPSWINNLHKDNALWSFVTLYDPGASAPANNKMIFATSSVNNTTSIGINIQHATGGNLNLTVRNASGSAAALSQSAGVFQNSKMNFAAFSVDEAAGNFHRVGEDSRGTVSGAYSSPSASAHFSNVAIGSSGLFTGTSIMDAGRKLGALAIWEGVALSIAQMDNLKTRLGSRRT